MNGWGGIYASMSRSSITRSDCFRPSIFLFFRTFRAYTRWLSIFLTSSTFAYAPSPISFNIMKSWTVIEVDGLWKSLLPLLFEEAVYGKYCDYDGCGWGLIQAPAVLEVSKPAAFIDSDYIISTGRACRLFVLLLVCLLAWCYFVFWLSIVSKFLSEEEIFVSEIEFLITLI